MPVVRAILLHAARAWAAQAAHAQCVGLRFGQRIAAGWTHDLEGRRADIHGFRGSRVGTLHTTALRRTALGGAVLIHTAHEILGVDTTRSDIAHHRSRFGDEPHRIAQALVIAAHLRPVTAKPPRDHTQNHQKQNQIDEAAHNQESNGFIGQANVCPTRGNADLEPQRVHSNV